MKGKMNEWDKSLQRRWEACLSFEQVPTLTLPPPPHHVNTEEGLKNVINDVAAGPQTYKRPLNVLHIGSTSDYFQVSRLQPLLLLFNSVQDQPPDLKLVVLIIMLFCSLQVLVRRWRPCRWFPWLCCVLWQPTLSSWSSANVPSLLFRQTLTPAGWILTLFSYHSFPTNQCNI